MRSAPGVAMPVPHYQRPSGLTRHDSPPDANILLPLYERGGVGGSLGSAILSAVKWAYEGGAAFDEAFDRDGAARAQYRGIVTILESFTQEEVNRRERLQKLALVDQGITFTVYGEKEGLERIFPFDFVPRIVPAAEWKGIQDGLVQRITTLNLFLADVYHDQKCLKDRVIPAELV